MARTQNKLYKDDGFVSAFEPVCLMTCPRQLKFSMQLDETAHFPLMICRQLIIWRRNSRQKARDSKKKLPNIKIKSSKYCLLPEMRIKTSIKKINKILITSTWSFNKHKRIPTFHRKSLLFKPDRRCVNKQTQCPGNIVYKR